MRPGLRHALAVAALAIAASEARAQDKIHLKGAPAPMEGTVVSMTYKEVSYESAVAGGVLQTQATKEVREIEFDPSRKPYEYVAGEDLFRRNEFDKAREKFERSLNDPKTGDPFKQFARWYLIQCAMELGEYDAAIAAAKKLRQTMPDSYFLRESFVLQYSSARALGKTSELDDAIKEFERAAQDKGVDDWKKSVELLRADLGEAKGDFKGARAVYEKYAGDRDPQLQVDARLGVLRCLAGAQDWAGLGSRAGSYIDEWKVKAGPPNRLLLGAYLARGKALLYGEKNNKQALIEFTRCAWDIAPKLGETSREHEESLAYGAIACARFAAEQKEKDRKDLYHERADQLKRELNRRYPGSSLMNAIDKEISAIPK